MNLRFCLRLRLNPCPFWEKVIEIFAIIILAAALLYALYFLGKKIIQLFRYLAELIRRLREESSWAGDTTGYSDERGAFWTASLRKIYGDALREWLIDSQKRG